MSKKLITGGGPKDAVDKAVGFFVSKADWNLDKENEYMRTTKRRFLELNKNIIDINKDASYSKDINRIKNAFAELDIDLNMDFSDITQAEQFVTKKLTPRSLPLAPPRGSLASAVGPEPVIMPPPPPSTTEDNSILAKGGVGEGENKPISKLSLRERITGLGVEVPENFKDTPPSPEVEADEIVSGWIVPAMDAIQNVHNKYYNATSSQMAMLNAKIDNVKLEDSKRTPPIFNSVNRITVKRMDGGKRKRNRKIGTKKKKHKRK